MFADDSSIFMSNKSLVEPVSKLKSELLKVNNWLKANKLFPNLAKTNYSLFCSKENKAFIHDYTLIVSVYRRALVIEST